MGIGPFVVGPAVERKMGLSAFSSLAIDAGMWRSAEWARKKGLYAELHAEPIFRELKDSPPLIKDAELPRSTARTYRSRPLSPSRANAAAAEPLRSY